MVWFVPSFSAERHRTTGTECMSAYIVLTMQLRSVLRCDEHLALCFVA